MSLPTTLLLDTNVISMLMRDPHGHVTEGLNRARALAPDLRVVTSVVVDGELRFGLERRGSAKLQGAYAKVMQIIEVLPLPPEAAQPYATLRGHLESRGQPIGPNDALIAAHALALGATLLTPGLRLWTRDRRLHAVAEEIGLASSPGVY